MATSWDRRTGVVTPEAVRLQFSEANVGSRGIALLIDWFAIFVILMTFNTMVGFLLAAASGGVPSWVAITMLIVVNFLVIFGYPVAFETLQRGKTPGKTAMGLRVVTVEGAPVAFRHAAIRAALALVDFAITVGLGAVLSTLFSKRHQRLGDMVAGTVVLRERTGEDAPWASHFMIPQGAEAYAVTIDPSGLAAGDYELVRSFLLRAQGLAAQPRVEIAERLAAGFARKLHHQRPATVSPELFLSCLAARYQERHGRLEQPASSPDAPPPTAGEPTPPTETWGDFSAPG